MAANNNAGEGLEGAPPEGGAPASATAVREEMRSLGATVATITEDLLELVSKERRLAQAEMADSMSSARRAASYGTAAAVGGMLAIGFLGLSLMYGLDTVMPLWVAALVTAGIIAVLGGLLAWMAKRALADFTVVPRRTANSVKEDLRWASAQMKQNGTSPGSGSSSASVSRN